MFSGHSNYLLEFWWHLKAKVDSLIHNRPRCTLFNVPGDWSIVLPLLTYWWPAGQFPTIFPLEIRLSEFETISWVLACEHSNRLSYPGWLCDIILLIPHKVVISHTSNQWKRTSFLSVWSCEICCFSESEKVSGHAAAEDDSSTDSDDVISLRIGPEVVELKAGIVEKWKRGSQSTT